MHYHTKTSCYSKIIKQWHALQHENFILQNQESNSVMHCSTNTSFFMKQESISAMHYSTKSPFYKTIVKPCNALQHENFIL